MAVLKAFRGLRPPVSIVCDLASRPYDVLSSAEAREEARNNPYSLLHITKPEIDLSPDVDEHDPVVYDKAKENFSMFINNGWLSQDDREYLYIYGQTMSGKDRKSVV